MGLAQGVQRCSAKSIVARQRGERRVRPRVSATEQLQGRSLYLWRLVLQMRLWGTLGFHKPRPANALPHNLAKEVRRIRRHSSFNKFKYSNVQAFEKFLSLRASNNTLKLGFLSLRRSAGTTTHRGVGKLIAKAKYPTAPDESNSEAKSSSVNCRGRGPVTSASISKRSSSMPLVATISGCPD